MHLPQRISEHPPIRSDLSFWPAPATSAWETVPPRNYPPPSTVQPIHQNVWAFRRGRTAPKRLLPGSPAQAYSPSFREAVMGYPTGWTACMPSETP